MRGAAVDTGAGGIGQADKDEHISAVGRGDDLCERGLRPVEDDAVGDEVKAGAAGERELRENEELDTLGLGVRDALDNALSVILRVRDPDDRGRGGGFNETVFHYIFT